MADINTGCSYVWASIETKIKYQHRKKYLLKKLILYKSLSRYDVLIYVDCLGTQDVE
jgi:hypothetical protein